MLRGQLLRELGSRLVGRLRQVADEDIGALLCQVRGDGGTDAYNPFPLVPRLERAYLLVFNYITYFAQRQ